MPEPERGAIAAEAIILAAHDAGWAAQFAHEASAVSAALAGVLVEVHHIGSTAIPDIAAKPIIDMLAVVTSVEELDGASPSLGALGYESKGEFGIVGRRYFRKDSPAGVRTHHLHAFALGSPHVERHLNFRDYLRSHPAAARAYEALKTSLAAHSRGDAQAYGDGKTDFIHQTEQRAAAWRRDIPAG